jgi:hypothetical protein
MSTARSDLLIYVGVALATTVGLFVLHTWYGTFLDQRYHAALAERGPSESLLAAREEEQKALSSGKVPISQAMSVIAHQGRPASVKPGPSQDLSAVSGWIHQRGFKPQTAFPVRAQAAKPAAPPPEAAAAPTEPAAAPTPPPAVKPPVRQLKLKTEAVKPAGPQVTR